MNNIPEFVPLSGLKVDREWDVVPFGVRDASGTVAAWHIGENPHMLIVGSENSGKSMLQKTVVAHCLKNPEEWFLIGIRDSLSHLPFLDTYPDQCLYVATGLDEIIDLLEDTRRLMVGLVEMGRMGEDIRSEVPAGAIIVDDLDLLLHPRADINDAKREYVAELLTEFLLVGAEAKMCVIAAGHSSAAQLQLPFSNSIMMKSLDSDEDIAAIFGAGHVDEVLRLSPGRVGSGVSLIDESIAPFQGFWTADEDLARIVGKV